MGLVDTDAIVLRTYNLAEADKIVVFFARKTGLVRGVARGARRLKSRFGAGLEPFTLVSLSYFEKEGRELVSLRQTEILRSHFALSADENILAALSYMAELVMEYAPPHEADERLFRLFCACVDALKENPLQVEAALRYFELWILRLSGFLPDHGRCVECKRIFIGTEPITVTSDGAFLCATCSNGAGYPVHGTVHEQVRATQRLSPAEYLAFSTKLNRVELKELIQITRPLIRRSLEREPRTMAVIGSGKFS